MRAIWNGAVLAESHDTVVVEGNHYFPHSSVQHDYLRASGSRSWCPWKGEASYLTVEVDGATNPDAAWYYPDPHSAAARIRGLIAFWHGVEIVP